MKYVFFLFDVDCVNIKKKNDSVERFYIKKNLDYSHNGKSLHAEWIEMWFFFNIFGFIRSHVFIKMKAEPFLRRSAVNGWAFYYI